MPEIRTLSGEELKEVYRRYMKKEFPLGELRPFSSIEKSYNLGEYAGYGYFYEESLLAYACFITYADSPYCLMDYLEVVPDRRDRGVGSAFLRALLPFISAKSGIFIEAESAASAKNDADRAVRERRLRFYEKNGAILTGLKCLLFTVDYEILFVPKSGKDYPSVSLEDVEAFYRRAYKPVFGTLCRPYRAEQQT